VVLSVLILAVIFLAQGLAALSSSVTAEEAFAQYEKLTNKATFPRANCATAEKDEVVVCGRRLGPVPRLPLPDERLGSGDVARHTSEAPSGTNAFRGGPAEPNRLLETLVKGAVLLKSAVTGEDPGF
jgi:hypothetical protein